MTTAQTRTLRSRIRHRLADLGWTQVELARRTGIHQPNLSKYLSGRADFTGSTLDRMLEALDMAVTAPATRAKRQPKEAR